MAPRWTSLEDKILKDNYSSIPHSELQKLLPGRSLDSIRGRAKVFGLHKLNMWTEEEEELLKRHYPEVGSDIYKLIPRHTKESCVDKANRMGLIMHRKWTPEEDNILKENYPINGSKSYKMIQNRSKDSCRRRVQELGLKRSNTSGKRPWSTEEDNIMKKYYPIMGPDVCYKLPNRTRIACSARAKALHLKMVKY